MGFSLRCGALIVLGGLVACSASTPATSVAEDPVLVAPTEARAHRISGPEPVYPLFAKAAGVAGAVHYEVDISSTGEVAATRLIHGSPMLEQSARDALAQWRFRPFQSGDRAVPARTIVTVTFGQPLASEVSSALDRFDDAMLRCADDSRRSAFADAERHCSETITIAVELASFDRTTDVRPMRLYGEAMAALGRHDAAIPQFENVVARVRHLPVFSLDRALSFRDLGDSFASLGRDDDALRAYRQADQQLSEALDGAGRNASFRSETVTHLGSFLPRYALLLDKAGRTTEADAVRSRLATIR